VAPAEVQAAKLLAIAPTLISQEVTLALAPLQRPPRVKNCAKQTALAKIGLKKAARVT